MPDEVHHEPTDHPTETPSHNHNNHNNKENNNKENNNNNNNNNNNKLESPQQPQQQKTVNGLPLPPRERYIDEHGYEVTKHALRFRGDDWDIVLNTKREALTNAFISDAAIATGEPAEHIQHIRFSVDERHRLKVRFTVRHKTHIPSSVVQDRLATYIYASVTALYEPRVKRPRPPGFKSRQTTQEISQLQQLHSQQFQQLNSQQFQTSSSFVLGRRPQPTVSCYGHAAAAVGPNGPEFRDEKEEEEPVEVEVDKTQETRMMTLLA